VTPCESQSRAWIRSGEECRDRESLQRCVALPEEHLQIEVAFLRLPLVAAHTSAAYVLSSLNSQLTATVHLNIYIYIFRFPLVSVEGLIQIPPAWRCSKKKKNQADRRSLCFDGRRFDFRFVGRFSFQTSSGELPAQCYRGGLWGERGRGFVGGYGIPCQKCEGER